ncbi:MAG: NfeD family protein [Candidatus Thorarchaeota archaeon]
MVSPRIKFILINIDELIVVIAILAAVGVFLPDLFLFAVIFGIVGFILFVVAKYYIMYPSMLDDFYQGYDVEGMVGKVIGTVTPTSGKVKIAQEIWDARCEDGEIQVGTKIRIHSRDSMILIVGPIDAE